MKTSSVIFVLGVSFSATSFAEPPSEIGQHEKSKAKIVSRLYQATYGQTERCKKAHPGQAAHRQEFVVALNTSYKLLNRRSILHQTYRDACVL